jgi:hypothetical protein
VLARLEVVQRNEEEEEVPGCSGGWKGGDNYRIIVCGLMCAQLGSISIFNPYYTNRM